MNLTEFFQALRKAYRTGKYQKIFIKNRELRFRDSSRHHYCPVTLVGKEAGKGRHKVCEPWTVGKKLSISGDVVQDIVIAADNAPNCQKQLRRRLLRSVN